MVTQQYSYAYGAVSPMDGHFDSLASCFPMLMPSVCKSF